MKPYALSADEDFDAFPLAPGRGEPADYCSRDGAQALKEKIEAYWRERGHHVMVALQNVGFHPAIRAVRFDVRSDMVNGMPRRSAKPVAQAEPALTEEFDAFEDDLAYE